MTKPYGVQQLPPHRTNAGGPELTFDGRTLDFHAPRDLTLEQLKWVSRQLNEAFAAGGAHQQRLIQQALGLTP